MEDLSYLTKMRRLRGSDEGIKIIGDRENLDNILKNLSNHSRDELLGEMMSCYCGERYGDNNWKSFDGGWTTPKVPTIYGEFCDKYKHLNQLGLDAGFITHLEDFFKFVNENNRGIEDYNITRNKFKEHMGERVVWRGMILTEEELEEVKNNGIASDYFRKSKEINERIEHLEAEVLSVFFWQLIEKHFHGENYLTPLISVSSHEDVAIAVGKHFGRRTTQKKQSDFYIFKINIPEMDLIYYTDHGVTIPSIQQRSIDRGTKLSIEVNGVEKEYSWDRNTESFIMYKINPCEIAEIIKPEIKSSSWKG